MTGTAIETVNTNVATVYLDREKFDQMQRVAKLFADSDMVPDHYKGKVSNCFIAINAALRHDMDPALYMQKTYIIGGKPAIETQLAIALLQMSGAITGVINYDMSGEGKSRACTATVWDAKTGEAISHTLDMKTVEACGWLSRPNSFWKKDPDLMLKYRSLMQLTRLHYSSVLLGLDTKEEAIDIEGTVVSRSVAGTPQVSSIVNSSDEIHVAEAEPEQSEAAKDESDGRSLFEPDQDELAEIRRKERIEQELARQPD